MRFVRTKTAITTLADEVVSDIESKKDILQFLKEKELDCAIQLNDTPLMPLVRIIEVNDDDFRFRSISQKANLTKTAKMSNISYLEVNTVDSEMIKTKKDVSRWMMLDA